MSYIRNVELSDAEVLVEIYRPYVENTAISFSVTVMEKLLTASNISHR